LRLGFALGVVPEHLHGKAQHKTLHARLSEEIARRPEQCTFFRTAPGRFYLKALAAEQSAPQPHRKVHRAPPRRKELRRDLMLAIKATRAPSPAPEVRLSAADLRLAFEEGAYAYLPWKGLRTTLEYLPVHSFIVVHQDGHALSYAKGRFRPDSDRLLASRSIGFGGAIFASDADFLFDSLHGIVENAIADLVQSIGLPRRMADDARYGSSVRPQFAVREPSTRNEHLDVVLSFACPADFHPVKTALSSNDLRWISLTSPLNDLSAYEPTSRKLLEFGWTRDFIW
jgi:hypothetical protein